MEDAKAHANEGYFYKSIFSLLYLFFLVSNVLAPPLIAIECVAIEGITIDVVSLPRVAIKGVHWARDGITWACGLDGCNASYTTKYNLI